MLLESFGNSTIGWSSITLHQNYILLSIALFGVLLHSLLWFQLFFHKIQFDFSLIFSVCYVVVDIFLFSAYFVQYGIRSTAVTPTWKVSCYFEAYFMLYFNIVEAFYLTLLNISRYWQIIRNKNVYEKHPYLIICICIIIPCLIMINMIVQHQMQWCVVIEDPGSSCSLTFNSVQIRVWNVIMIFCLPTVISFGTSIRCVLYLKNTHSQQVLARRNHHCELIYRFCIFYSIWIILWGPFVLLTHLDIETIDDQTNFLVTVGSAVEATIDGILLSILDKRFGMAWGKTFNIIRRRLGWHPKNRIHPRF